MHKSKLELYEEVLQALAEKPLTIDSIAFKCNMDCVVLSQRLVFLANSGLVQEANCKNKTVYALTRRGTAISKALAITKRLERLQNRIEVLDDLHVLPPMSDYNEGKAKRTR
jgi:predicted transcriptional regulator